MHSDEAPEHADTIANTPRAIASRIETACLPQPAKGRKNPPSQKPAPLVFAAPKLTHRLPTAAQINEAKTEA